MANSPPSANKITFAHSTLIHSNQKLQPPNHTRIYQPKRCAFCYAMSSDVESITGRSDRSYRFKATRWRNWVVYYLPALLVLHLLIFVIVSLVYAAGGSHTPQPASSAVTLSVLILVLLLVWCCLLIKYVGVMRRWDYASSSRLRDEEVRERRRQKERRESLRGGHTRRGHDGDDDLPVLQRPPPVARVPPRGSAFSPGYVYPKRSRDQSPSRDARKYGDKHHREQHTSRHDRSQPIYHGGTSATTFAEDNNIRRHSTTTEKHELRKETCLITDLVAAALREASSSDSDMEARKNRIKARRATEQKSAPPVASNTTRTRTRIPAPTAPSATPAQMKQPVIPSQHNKKVSFYDEKNHNHADTRKTNTASSGILGMLLGNVAKESNTRHIPANRLSDETTLASDAVAGGRRDDYAEGTH